MTDKKGQKFYVPDLKAKVRTLEALFGEKFMRSGLNPRTIDKWLKEPNPTPYLTSLKKYFGAVGMKESDIIKEKDEFSEKTAEIYTLLKRSEQVRYSKEDILTIFNRFLEGYTPEPLLLGFTLRMVQKETIKNDFKYLKGYYHMYHYWKSADEEDRRKVRRNLITLYDLDGNNGLMKCRAMVSPMKHLKKEELWEYEGWVFNIKNKLFWLLECMKGMPPEIVTFNIYKPPFWPEQDRFYLYGIVSALSLEGIPSASIIMLKKIKGDDELKFKLGYFSQEEIKAEGHGIDILNYINNEIKNNDDILSAKPMG